MNKIFLVLAALAVFVAAGCDSTGTPVTFSAACEKANDDQRIEVAGYFDNTGSSMCSSSRGGPMRCPINFVETPGAKKGIIRAEIDLGSGHSSVEDVDGRGLMIHDVNSEDVGNSDKVKVTADVTVLDFSRDNENLKDCYVKVKKIEKMK